MPMSLLHSLRLSVLPVAMASFHGIQHAFTQVTEPLFGGHIPLLRYVVLIQWDINWFDPVICNLTGLLIQRPDAPFNVSNLV
jgi:hypothetical protein